MTLAAGGVGGGLATCGGARVSRRGLQLRLLGQLLRRRGRSGLPVVPAPVLLASLSPAASSSFQTGAVIAWRPRSAPFWAPLGQLALSSPPPPPGPSLATVSRLQSRCSGTDGSIAGMAATADAAARSATTAPFGAWKSPITKELVTASGVSLGGVAVTDDGRLLRLEGRPAEGGRNVLVLMNADGTATDITPPGFNVRTRVHEYGGGSFLLGDGGVFFSNFSDQRLYFQKLDGSSAPRAVSPDVGEAKIRFADGVFDAARRLVYTVFEDHRAGGHEPANAIVAVDVSGAEAPASDVISIATGEDFYAFPRLSPDGRKLAFVSWRHPDMPWDRTRLWVAQLGEDGRVLSCEVVAGGSEDMVEAIVEPQWTAAGELLFVSDRGNGWWNLYSLQGGEVTALTQLEAEFSGPLWQFGLNTFTVLPGVGANPGALSVLARYKEDGMAKLALFSRASGGAELTRTEIATSGYTTIFSVSAAGGRIVASASSAARAPSAVEIKADATGAGFSLETLWCSSTLDMEAFAPYISIPKSITFPTTVPGEVAHAIYYPPTNADFVAPEGARPPLLVKSHGGPTAATDTTLKLGIQYYTSRGYAVLDVNYSGSTSYGRAYRERLYGTWGVRDVDDCCSAAEYLVERGLADPERLAIDGGSAGGFTTLAVLTFRNTFKAGASLYGVSDLMLLANDTHKFEARYLDKLIGPLDTARQLYFDRSPINHTDQLQCPIILFQGLEDKVVPPNQARVMYEAVKAKGLPVALVEYEGEQHGFRKAENIQRTLEAELYFYSVVFKLPLADDVVPVHIDNL